jgi:predicted DNA-binding transcriptional regulator AlpA
MKKEELIRREDHGPSRSTTHDLLDPKNWIAPKALAAVLAMNVQSIYNRIHSGGDLPPTYKRGRAVRFFRPEVEDWLKGGRRVQASACLRIDI